MNSIKDILNHMWNEIEDKNAPINSLISILDYSDVFGAIDDLVCEIKDRIKP